MMNDFGDIDVSASSKQISGDDLADMLDI